MDDFPVMIEVSGGRLVGAFGFSVESKPSVHPVSERPPELVLTPPRCDCLGELREPERRPLAQHLLRSSPSLGVVAARADGADGAEFAMDGGELLPQPGQLLAQIQVPLVGDLQPAKHAGVCGALPGRDRRTGQAVVGAS